MKKTKSKGRTKINIPQGQLDFENKPIWSEIIMTLIVASVIVAIKITNWLAGFYGFFTLKSYILKKFKKP